MSRAAIGSLLRSGIPGVETMSRVAYRAAVHIAARSLGALAGTEEVFLRRSMARGDWVPGVSDIDLFVLKRGDPPGQEEAYLRSFDGRTRGLKRFLPMLGECELGSRGELENYLRWGGMRAREAGEEWKALLGRALSPLSSQTRESPLKRRWLDPWTEVYHSFVELSRKLWAEDSDPPEKRDAHARRLFFDIVRYAACLDAAVPPLSRAQTEAALPEARRMPAQRLWLSAFRRLEEASDRVLTALESAPGTSSSDALFPREGSPWAGLVGRLAGRPCVSYALADPPYYLYIVAPPDAPDEELAGLMEDVKRLYAEFSCPRLVPVVISPNTMLLAAQSSYSGGPLGWATGYSTGSGPVPGKVWGQWAPAAAGRFPGPMRLIPPRMRFEAAAESAAWMALWWRLLWTRGSIETRFALFHLYTRTLGLRLLLAGRESGPFSDWKSLWTRAAFSFPDVVPHLEHLTEWAATDPSALRENSSRWSLGPEHLRFLMEQMRVLQEGLSEGRSASLFPCSSGASPGPRPVSS